MVTGSFPSVPVTVEGDTEHPVLMVALQLAMLMYSTLLLLASAMYIVPLVASTARAVATEEARRLTVATHVLDAAS